MTTITIVGVCASICTAVSMLPQLAKVLKEKKAENVSLWMLLVLFIGLALWIVYGSMKNDWILIISNAFSAFINLLLAIAAIHFKNKNTGEK
jgi:MtN3 and saliva related transmembrane protein